MVAEDEHGQAVLVDVIGAGGPIVADNDFPHITLSCEDSVSGSYTAR